MCVHIMLLCARRAAAVCRYGVLLTYRSADPSREIHAEPQVPSPWVDRAYEAGWINQQQFDLFAEF